MAVGIARGKFSYFLVRHLLNNHQKLTKMECMTSSEKERPFQEGQEIRSPAAPERYKVFLVDDSEDFLELFRVYGKKKNFQVITAASGKEALSYLKLNEVDCIILDYMLPDLNGAEIFQILREDVAFRKRQNVPVLVISAVSIPTHKLRDLYRSGVKLFLPKSFGLRELTVVVENICFAAKVEKEEPFRDRPSFSSRLAAP
ncbi:MAG: response regulator [Calditrichaeota bacterium]|nr:MAG: response regulator [Calditrichota bacterium]